MIVGGQTSTRVLTFFDYHAPSDQGLMPTPCTFLFLQILLSLPGGTGTRIDNSDLVVFGWRIGYSKTEAPSSSLSDHGSVAAQPTVICEFIANECSYKATLGPFQSQSFCNYFHQFAASEHNKPFRSTSCHSLCQQWHS